MRNSRSAR